MHFVKRLLKYIGKLFIAFLLMLAFMWFLIWSEQKRDSRLAREITDPLEELIASKYSSDDFCFSHLGYTDEYTDTVKISSIYIRVSEEMQYSDEFLQNCHEIMKLISEYVGQHPSQFTLNIQQEFELIFDMHEYGYEDYMGSSDYALTFTNIYPFNSNRSATNYDKYYNKLIALTVHGDDYIKLSEIPIFEEIMSLDIYTVPKGCDDISELVKMPNLKNVTLRCDEYLSDEKQKEFAETFCEHGIDSSTWYRLYGR